MQKNSYQPLPARMRPRHIQEFIGQSHILGPGKPMRRAIEQHSLHSMILWGPPGVGKTTLARLLADNTQARFVSISAVLAGVKEIREVVEQAHQQSTVLFVDEIHRFNKAQQDAFLPFVEDGTITLIGATTQNPSFELNNALLSRARVYVLKSLTQDEIILVINQALQDIDRGFGARRIIFADELKLILADAADGDARKALNFLEICLDFAEESPAGEVISLAALNSVISDGVRKFDHGGDLFYEQISALHKAVRGSAPDAAVYWLCRMLDGGCDGEYLARRIVRMASEDIGNADPRGLTIALDAWQAYERLGAPEGHLALAQAVIYLAVAAKSNACYVAFNEAMVDVAKYGSLAVPMQLRNAPTKLLKQLDYGKNYRYAHDEANAYAAGENYFPDAMSPKQYYRPVPRGMEIKIGEKLALLKKLDKQ